MSTRIEWADVSTPATYVTRPGAVTDRFSRNAGPALLIGGGAVLEAKTPEALIEWLEHAISEVRRWSPVRTEAQLRREYEGVEYDHPARPDDLPEPGDRCKDCGEDITWRGPSHTDWLHVDDKENR